MKTGLPNLLGAVISAACCVCWRVFWMPPESEPAIPNIFQRRRRSRTLRNALHATQRGSCQRRYQSGLEEHLSDLFGCRLESTEEYVAAMKAAADGTANVPVQGTRRS
jgi:hypothetical protein